MKQVIRTILSLLVLLSLSGNAFAYLKLTDPDNPHNLSSTSNNAVEATSDTRICVFCHTPHGADPQTPLWNRKDITDVESFPIYNSATLVIKGVAEAEYDAALSTYPNGSTRMCLSCHDGSTALGYGIGDLFTTDVIDMTIDNLNGRASQIDLSVTHPVSFVYDVGNDGVDDVVINTINAAKSGEYSLPLVPDDAPLDDLGRMQCTTCHNPHRDTRLSSPDGMPFWRHSTEEYQFACDECHLGADGTNPDIEHQRVP